MIMSTALLWLVMASVNPPDTTSENARLVQTLQRLHELSAARPPDGEALHRDVAAALAWIEDSRTLYRVAKLARAMQTGAAEDERIDHVYWVVFWQTTRRLSEHSDELSRWFLSDLARPTPLGGGEKLIIDELLEKQRKRAKLRKE